VGYKGIRGVKCRESYEGTASETRKLLIVGSKTEVSMGSCQSAEAFEMWITAQAREEQVEQ
jgi:hypothetical protein